jgi:hypothetical protein
MDTYTDPTNAPEAPVEAPEAPVEAPEAPVEAPEAPEQIEQPTEAHEALYAESEALTRRIDAVRDAVDRTPVDHAAMAPSQLSDASYYAERSREQLSEAATQLARADLSAADGAMSYARTYTNEAERFLAGAATYIADRLAELSAVLPWGTESEADASRGARALDQFRWSRSWDDTGATVSDLLAAWNARDAAWSMDVQTVTSTLRAAARSFGWENHYDDVMDELSGSLTHPMWRPTHERPPGLLKSADGATGAPTITRPPAHIGELANQCTSAEQIAAGYARTVSDHQSDLSALSEAFRDKAVEQSWCGDYERTVARLNREVSSYAGEPFQSRHRDYDVTMYVTVTVTRTVEASDEDAAREYVDDMGHEAIIRAVRAGDYEVTDYDVSESE